MKIIDHLQSYTELVVSSRKTHMCVCVCASVIIILLELVIHVSHVNCAKNLCTRSHNSNTWMCVKEYFVDHFNLFKYQLT